MPSPFPGMDPYLEGYLWPDVHHSVAVEISRRLAPQLRPKYVARLKISVLEDPLPLPESEISIMYPEVEAVLAARQPQSHPAGTGQAAVLPVEEVLEAPLTIPILKPVLTRQATVEVRDVGRNELVAVIEILSPVNKREPGLTTYRRKRNQLIERGVHLLELDLLRRGTRPLEPHPGLPACHYLITLTRAHARRIEVWPLMLADRLPTVPVPLRDPDPEVPLALGPALAAIYDEAAYDLSLDYRKPPAPPPLTGEEWEWLQELIARAP
jgi:hypothetical protein